MNSRRKIDLHQVKVIFRYQAVPSYQAELIISENEYTTMKGNPELLKAFMVEHSTGTVSSASGADQQLLPSLILFIKERNNEEYLIHTIEREMMNVEPILANKHMRTDDRRVISLKFSAVMRPSIVVNVPKSLQNKVFFKKRGAITKTLVRRVRRFNPEKKWLSLQSLCDEFHFDTISIREHYLPHNFINLDDGVEVGVISMIPKQRTYPEQRRPLGSHNHFCDF
jgi:hypothetical protein